MKNFLILLTFVVVGFLTSCTKEARVTPAAQTDPYGKYFPEDEEWLADIIVYWNQTTVHVHPGVNYPTEVIKMTSKKVSKVTDADGRTIGKSIEFDNPVDIEKDFIEFPQWNETEFYYPFMYFTIGYSFKDSSPHSYSNYSSIEAPWGCIEGFKFDNLQFKDEEFTSIMINWGCAGQVPAKVWIRKRNKNKKS